ncbi:hypothetical protein ACH5RR_005046 [Cinchona calisaya]|uniref:Wound-induced protein 1 n=1 Tax=Cinchona calisaya TaxID=153742 RepID=A0ABD3AZR0_9GENT
MAEKNAEISVLEAQNNNRATVDRFYKALASGKTEGSPMLTGKSSHKAFKFNPRSIEAVVADYVIVEGWEGVQAYWVHVWTIKGGLITQFREYFNTWLTVAILKPVGCCSTSSTLWQSHPRDLAKRSLPGLMLAI